MIKPIAEKTTSLFGGISSGFTSKLGQLKNSESFRSLEEKVGSAYENVKVSNGSQVSRPCNPLHGVRMRFRTAKVKKSAVGPYKPNIDEKKKVIIRSLEKPYH